MRILLFISFYLLKSLLFAQLRPSLMMSSGHSDYVSSMALSPNGNRLVTVSTDLTAKLWDISTGRLLATLARHSQTIHSVYYSADSKFILTSSMDSSAILWNADNGQFIKSFLWDKHRVFYSIIEFGSDHKSVLVKDMKDSIILSTLPDDKIIYKIKVLKKRKQNQPLSFNKNFSKLLMEVDTNGYRGIAVCDISSGKIISKISERWTEIWTEFKSTGHVKHEVYTSKDILRAVFSPDGNKVITVMDTNFISTWDAKTGNFLKRTTFLRNEKFCDFNKDGTQFATIFRPNTVLVRDLESGIIIDSLYHSEVKNILWLPDNKTILSVGKNDVLVWHIDNNGIYKSTVIKTFTSVDKIMYDKQGKYIVCPGGFSKIDVFDTQTGKKQATLEIGSSNYGDNAILSKNGKRILFIKEREVSVIDIFTGKTLVNEQGENAIISNQGDKVIIVKERNNVKVISIDSLTAKLLFQKNLHQGEIKTLAFNSNGSEFVLSFFRNDSIFVFNAANGKIRLAFKDISYSVNQALFSEDNTKIISLYNFGYSINILRFSDAKTGAHLYQLYADEYEQNTQISTPDESTYFTSRNRNDYLIDIFSSKNQKYYKSIAIKKPFRLARISPDSQFIFTTDEGWKKNNISLIRKIDNEAIVARLEKHEKPVFFASFRPDNTQLITVDEGGLVIVWSVPGFKPITSFELGYGQRVIQISFENNVILSSCSNEYSIFDLNTGKKWYSIYNTGNGNFAYIDDEGRFDASSTAQELLYYVSPIDLEVVMLEETEKERYEPDLIPKIVNKQPFKYTFNLPPIEIFGVTPIIEESTFIDGKYIFKIKVRKGGLGEIRVIVNNNEIKVILPNEKKIVNGYYLIEILQSDVKDYFSLKRENKVSLVVTTKQNWREKGTEKTISHFTNNQAAVSNNSVLLEKPHLYFVGVGVNEYKNSNLNLNYAVKDVEAIENVLRVAYSNFISPSHIHTYLLKSSPNETDISKRVNKNNIREVLKQIVDKAKPDDIFFLQLSGHAVHSNSKTYFLTQDAINTGISDEDTKMAISIDTLNKWMSEIKVNKRIFIFDACNGLTEKEQNTFTKDDPTSYYYNFAIKDLSKRSFNYLFTASPRNKPAYESTKLKHGILTYALLQCILEEKALTKGLLDLRKWFVEAKKIATDISQKYGMTQVPEPMFKDDGNVMLGKLDDKLLKIIKGSLVSMVYITFSEINFREKKSQIDGANLGQKVIQAINNLAVNKTISFQIDSQNPDAYLMYGDYDLDEKKCTISIFKKNSPTQKLEVFDINNIDLKDIDKIAFKIVENAYNKLVEAEK